MAMAEHESNTHGQGPTDPHPGSAQPPGATIGGVPFEAHNALPTDAAYPPEHEQGVEYETPIVVSSAQLAAMRNGDAGGSPPGAPSRAPYRRAISRDRARLSYRDDGSFVVVVGEGPSERVVEDVYRYALMHGGDGATPVLALWLNQPDPSGVMPARAPIDVREAELVDVEQLKLTVHKLTTLVTFARSTARRACAHAVKLTLTALGHPGRPDGLVARSDLPAGVDPPAIVDNAMLEAFAEYHIATPLLGDAGASAQATAQEIRDYLSGVEEVGGALPGDVATEQRLLAEASDQLIMLCEAAAWVAIESAQRETARREGPIAGSAVAAPSETPSPAVEHRARELANRMLDEERRAHELALAQMAERLNAGAQQPTDEIDPRRVEKYAELVAGERRTAIEDFADWLVGPDGPRLMQARTAAIRESRVRDLVLAYTDTRAGHTAGDDEDANETTDGGEPGAAP